MTDVAAPSSPSHGSTPTVPPDPQVAAAKDALRRDLRAQRRALSPQDRLRARAGLATAVSALLDDDAADSSRPCGPLRPSRPSLPGSLRAPELALFAPLPGEPPLLAALTDAWAQLPHRPRIWLPICAPHRRLRWGLHDPLGPADQLAPTGPAGIMEPTGAAREALPEHCVVIVPALAYDATGLRLGMGGGFYDTLIAGRRRAGMPGAFIGVCFDHELLPAGAVPAQHWDARVDAVLTPSGLHAVTSATD